jgi:hypothetical protein
VSVTLHCQHCGKPFQVPPTRVRRGNPKFCGMACMGLSTRVPVMERFWSKVNKAGPVPVSHPEYGNCWIWTGTLHDHGYGRIDAGSGQRGRHLYAHRLAWEQATGSVLTDEDVVCHTCDIPACARNDEVGAYEVDGRTYVRHGHLFVATQVGNNADRDAKKRLPRGELHAFAKLTDAQAARAIALFKTGTISQSELARAFGVTPAVIGDLLSGETWQHINGQDIRHLGRNGSLTLTTEQRQAIRDATDVSQKALARQYGVSQGYVSRLRSGKR